MCGGAVSEESLPSLVGKLRGRLFEMFADEGIKRADTPLERCTSAAERYGVQIITVKATELSLVCMCRRTDALSGPDVVLKFIMPETCPQAFDWAFWHAFGPRVVTPLVIDLEQTLLIFERIAPGGTLKELAAVDDAAATKVAADELAASLARPGVERPPAVPNLREWCSSLIEANPETAFSNSMGAHVRQAQEILADLIETSDRPALHHGDLHHENILRSNTSGWRVIDPKGVMAEPAFEVGALMRNPGPELSQRLDVESLLVARLRVLEVALGISARRIAEWSYVQAVLSYIWASEDGDGVWLAHASRISGPLWQLVKR